MLFLYIYWILESKYFLAMDKWLNLNKNDNDADDNATNSPKAGKSIEKQAYNVRKRKYDESFLRFGFAFQICKGNEQPLCLICNELLVA